MICKNSGCKELEIIKIPLKDKWLNKIQYIMIMKKLSEFAKLGQANKTYLSYLFQSGNDIFCVGIR